MMKNTKNLLVAFSILTLSAAAAIAADRQEADSFDDAQIIGMLHAINSNEINAANEALLKESEGEVFDYATDMQRAHSKNLEKTLDLSREARIEPEYNDPEVVDQRQKGAEELVELTGLEGDSFAKAYMKDMVKDHTAALKMIDKQMLNSVENDELKDHLKETREHVAQHLEQAREIRRNL